MLCYSVYLMLSVFAVFNGFVGLLLLTIDTKQYTKSKIKMQVIEVSDWNWSMDRTAVTS